MANEINSTNNAGNVSEDENDVFATVSECPECYEETFFINIEDSVGECTNDNCKHEEGVGCCSECLNDLPYSNLSESYRNKLICEECMQSLHDNFWTKDNMIKLLDQ